MSPISQAIDRLAYLCGHIPPLLEAMPAEAWEQSYAPGKWSRKQVLGHLIDSAANNHHRFVKAQFMADFHAPYQQDAWNAANFYSERAPGEILAFWLAYNQHLLHLVSHIDEDILQNSLVGGDRTRSLAWLIGDYVVHMEHHLRQILAY